MRGRLVSRPAHAVLREAEKLVAAGVRELLVISQDTSAYGLDRRHDEHPWKDRTVRTHITDLARELGALGAWVRLHYVYPYPHVRDLIPLMADGLILPYLDIPFQHSHPDVLRRMARPAASAKTLDEIARWRAICPDITLRSTFIVGYPGETEAEFAHLLDWLDEARLDRVGAFKYENVAGARANALPDHVPEAVKEDRWQRFMAKAGAISAAKLAAKVGTRLEVIVDAVDDEAATCRTKGDAPEIDGHLYIDEGFERLTPGDILTVAVEEVRRLRPLGPPRLRARYPSPPPRRPPAIGPKRFPLHRSVNRVYSRAATSRFHNTARRPLYRIVIPIRLFTGGSGMALDVVGAGFRPHRHQFLAAGPERARLRAVLPHVRGLCRSRRPGAALGRGIGRQAGLGRHLRRLPVHRRLAVGELLGGDPRAQSRRQGHPELAQRRELVRQLLGHHRRPAGDAREPAAAHERLVRNGQRPDRPGVRRPPARPRPCDRRLQRPTRRP